MCLVDPVTGFPRGYFVVSTSITYCSTHSNTNTSPNMNTNTNDNDTQENQLHCH